MRKRLLSVIATTAIIAAACGGAATTPPSTAPSVAPSATPVVTPPPIPPDLTKTNYAPEAVGNKGGKLLIGLSGDPSTVWYNIYDTFANDSDAFGPALWGLINNTADFAYYPQLSSNVPTTANGGVVVNADGTMDVTYKLRDGAMWSDGQPITCDDMAYQVTWQLDPGQADAGNVQGATGWEDITKVDGGTGTTCVVHFKKIYEQYLGLWTPLLPAHYLKTVPVKDAINKLYTDTGLKTAVWSGPYMPTAWAHDAEIDYVPNPQFWSTIKKADAPFSAVTLKLYSDTDAEIAGFVNGEIDVAMEFNHNHIASMGAVDPAAIDKIDGVTYEQHSWNYAALKTKFGDAGAKAMMEALHYAYDKDEVNQRITGGRVSPSCSFTNNLTWFYADIPCYKHDADKAASILAAAGFTKGADGTLALNGQKAEFLACMRADRQYRIDTMNLVASQLAPLGIKLTVTPTTPSVLFKGWGLIEASTPCNLTHGNFDVAEFAWVSTPDPLGIYLLYLSTTDPSQGDHSGQNYIRVNNPDLDALLKDAQGTVDLLKIKDDFAKIQALYVDPANAFPEIPLYNWQTVLLKSKTMHNVVNNSTAAGQDWNLEDWWKSAQ